MLNRIPLYWVACFAVFAMTQRSTSAADAVDAATIGTQIADLEFKDRFFLRRRLSEFDKAKAIVIVASNTSCPIVQKYWPKLIRLHKEYHPQGVRLIGLNVLHSDSLIEISTQSVKYSIPFPLVKDAGSAAKSLGLTRTPEVVVLDAKRHIRYRGRIDDQHRLGASAPQVRHDDLRNAIKAVLADETPTVTTTSVDGCLIPTAPEIPTDASLTWSQDIQPLFKEHCVVCHQAGTEAPFALQTYDDVTAQSAMIAEVVSERRMPPWYASDKFREFVNHRALTSAQRTTIRSWIKSGMKPGPPVKKSSAPVRKSLARGEWELGKPDQIITTVENHQLPADGYIPYRYSVLPYVFTAETWIKAIEILPENPRVVHHANLIAMPLGGSTKDAYFITGKVPGAQPLTLQEGVAVRIPKGTVLALQIHFTTTGQPEECRLSVGLHYAGGTINKAFRHVLVRNLNFKIPPGDPFFKVQKSETLDADTTGIGLFTHMHLRGRDMTFIAHYPDGRAETLLTVPNYSFDWQIGYRWDEGARRFPKGTRIECVAHFDNSSFNPFNPDPTATVKEGPQTYHEMMYGFYFYTRDDENLQLEIDPKTGRRTRVAEKAN